MAIDPGLIVIAIVGAMVGGLAAWTSLGAGLSFALLALVGVPLPGALFVTKLACAGTDASAWLASRNHPMARATKLQSKHLLPGIVAGCVGATCVVFLPGWAAAGIWITALLSASALAGAATSARTWQNQLLGLYIGACGIGAGLIQFTLARIARRDPHEAQVERRVLGTGANLGSAVLLAALTPVALGDLAWQLWLLALSQAIGAGLVARLLSRRAAKACETIPDPILSDQIPR